MSIITTVLGMIRRIKDDELLKLDNIVQSEIKRRDDAKMSTSGMMEKV